MRCGSKYSEQYKEKVRKRLAEQKATDAENVEKEEAITKATDNTTIDIPEAMVNTELDRMVSEFAQRIQQQGLDLQTQPPNLQVKMNLN
ncbi:hypothetical protein ACVPOY_12440 [Staphylococcus aureus]